MGASALIFAVLDGMLLEPLPYPEPERIVRMWQVDDRDNRANPSDPNFFDLKGQSRSFAQLAQFGVGTESVAGGREPARLFVASVSQEFLDVLAVQPLLGRVFVAEEQTTGAAPTALVSYGYWQRYLGGTADFAAQPLKIGDRLHTVIGVMPPGFDYPNAADVWTPRELSPVSPSRTGHNYQSIGRLGSNVSLDQARSELSGIARALKAQYGDDTFMSDVQITPLHEQLVGEIRPALLVLGAAAVLLFVVACANALSLLLAHAFVREQELAVRAALGASRLRLAAQFFAETLVLCAGGGALGLLFAWWGTDLVIALAGGAFPLADAMRVDDTTVMFGIGLVLIAAASLSVFVASHASMHGVGAHGNRRASAGGTRSRLRDLLVAGQIALALVLLVGAALLARTFVELARVDPGFDADGTLIMSLALPDPHDEAARLRNSSFYAGVLDRLRALPGVQAVGGITMPPLDPGIMNGRFIVQSHLDEIPDFAAYRSIINDPARTAWAQYRIASEGYFAAMGIPLLRGRDFAATDVRDSSHAAIVSESLADSTWPGEDPLGKLIQFGGMDGDFTPFVVVGVVSDVRDYSLEREAAPMFYGYYRQRPRQLAAFSIALRAPNAEALVPAAREIVRAFDPDVPPEFRTSESLVSSALTQWRFNLVMLGAFGGAALLLALTGIYGAIAFSVARRTHEIGVRLALGAQEPGVVRMIVGRSLVIAAAGIAVGLVAAFGGSQVVASLLYGVSPLDPFAYASAAVFLLVAALVAAWLPARRAAQVDPIVALRHE